MVLNNQEYFNNRYLKKDKVEYRLYQDSIVNKCKRRNSLIILPTGLGKTIIGVLLIADALMKYPASKIIILAPTRPLVSQHRGSCAKFLKVDKEKIVAFTGFIPPRKRINLFDKSTIIISTPQVIKNDLIRGRYELSKVSLIIFDEAHKTRGYYAYNFISQNYMKSCVDPLILGLTASPGKDFERIQQICDNLFIETIVYKNYNDTDVSKYIYDIDTYINFIDLPVKVLELIQIWEHIFKKFLKFFIERKLINPYKKFYSKLDFLKIAHDLTFSLKYETLFNSNNLKEEILNQLYYKDPLILDIIKKSKLDIHSIYSYCSSCISLLHGKDLLETQDITLFKSFLDKISFKAQQNILSAERIANSEHYKLVTSVIEKEGISNLSHPKIEKIIELIQDEFSEFQNKKIIIFTQYREMAELLKNKLSKIFHNQLVIEKFIGQTSKVNDTGFPQYMQIEILENFRENKINILIATSVAEEGLDIPNVDAIIFYEPVPSEIRLIQRRGRTGRTSPGRCYILLTEGTVDIPFHIVAKRKENSMNYVLLNKEDLNLNTRIERKSINFEEREKNNLESKLVENFNERREREYELLANQSIENILSQLDEFSKSEEYNKFKGYGLTFFSDLIDLDKKILKNKILTIKGKKKSFKEEPKVYLNKNIKCLINIVKNYSKNRQISLEELRKYAHQEDIREKKFYIHFNQACYLGYLRKKNDIVQLVMDYK